MKKLWEGRLGNRVMKEVEEFTSSLDIDKKLAEYDITGSIAYAKALSKAGILAKQEERKIIKSLKAIFKEIRGNNFKFIPSDEDIHSAIERRLVELCGDEGKKLHSGRSRNEQIVLDEKLYLRDTSKNFKRLISQLIYTIAKRAIEESETLLPGYTHLQRAQVITLGHHLNAYGSIFLRHLKRIEDFERRNDELPLGSGALSGNTLKLDRSFLAKELGFKRVSSNSLDSVSFRDFISEFVFICSLIMQTLSRISEELILWVSDEFNFAELPDEVCTGSSLMPHKKNPDVLELVRGRSAILNGLLVSILTLEKNLPLAYNRDLQEDKTVLFPSVEITEKSLKIMKVIIDKTIFKKDRMIKASQDWKLLMTDLAELLVKRGVPFRVAHSEVGKFVSLCLKRSINPLHIGSEKLRKMSNIITSEDLQKLSPFKSVKIKDSQGGTSPLMVKKTSRTLINAVKKYL